MTSTLLTAAIILGAIIVLIALFIYVVGKGHNKKVAKQSIVFKDAVLKNNLEISEKEEINHYVFAIDKVKHILLYFNFTNNNIDTTVIDLQKVKSVRVDTEENSIYEEKRGKSVLVEKQVTKVQVEINLEDNQQTQHLLPLYQYVDGVQDIGSVKKRAEHWHATIISSKHFSNFSKPKA